MFKNALTIILVIISVLLLAFYVRPAYDNINKLRSDQDEYNVALENARSLQSIRESLLAKRNSFTPTDLNRLNKMLPDNVDNVKLILELQTMAQKHNLELKTATTEEDEEEEDLLDTQTKDYGIITLDFELFGQYSNFVAFLDEVAQTLRLTDIEAISFDKGRSDDEDINYNLGLRTYWLKDNI